MALARRHAFMPTDGTGLMGSADDTAQPPIARVLICVHDGQLVALHGFIKKTQKILDDELAMTRKRQKELEK